MNLVRATQETVASIVSTDDCKWLCEDSKSIEFEVKDAMAKTGIAPVVVVTQLDYQGHNGDVEFYDVSLELQVAENPPVSRFYKGGKSAYDVALGALHTLCGYSSGIFGSFCPGTVTQQVEDGLVIVRAEATCTYAWKPHTEPGWTAVGTYGGTYTFAGEKQDGTKTYKCGSRTLEVAPLQSGWTFTLIVPDVEEIVYGVTATTRPNTLPLDGASSRTEFTADEKQLHWRWEAAFEDQDVHEDCALEWLWTNNERHPQLGMLTTHHFRSDDKEVVLKVQELPPQPQTPDKDLHWLQVGDGPQSTYEPERSADVVQETWYHATLTKSYIEPPRPPRF